MTEYLIPDPEYIIRGNRVKCTYCGIPFKNAFKYKNHFIKRHMNPDGTWREAGHNFERIGSPTPDEAEAIDAVESDKVEKNYRPRERKQKPWWEQL